MVETIAPVVYGNRRRYLLAVSIHVLSAGVTGALFGSALGLMGMIGGAPWTTWGLVLVVAVATLYAGRELIGLPIPLFDRRRQVPDWWRTFYGPLTTAALYGAGLGIGFLTFLRHGTYLVACAIALASGDPLVGAALGASFGAARGVTALSSWRTTDSEGPDTMVARLELRGSAPGVRILNGVTCLMVGLAALASLF